MRTELGDFMKKDYIINVSLIAALALGSIPAFAIALDKPPMPNKSALTNKNLQKKTTQQDESVNPLYPAKYTTTYINEIKDTYRSSAKDEVFFVALDMLKGTNGQFSRDAVLGNNLTSRPIKIEFKDLGLINPKYSNYDALGWKRGKSLYIYISQKHNTSPAIAIAALLSHEALHQDEFNSLAEETYAWTMEAAVWCELLELYPDYELNLDSLVQRENTLKKLFERGNHTDKYVRKTVYSNEGYQNLPETSPGFENL